MSIFFTLIAFIFALGVLITFHEFGHYLVARLSGVKVLRFSVGFGRPLFTKRWGKDQTEWVIAAIPLGGYVKMLDEREGKVAQEDLPRSFNHQPVSRRFAIVAAGPMANFLLAILLYWVIFVFGVSGIKPMLGPIEPMTPASFASFEAGETIIEIANEPVASWQEMHWKLLTLALDKSQDVNVKTINQKGEVTQRYLDLSNLSAKDLDSNFIEKIGLSVYQPVIKPIIAQVIDNEAGYRAGLLAGDEILAVNGEDIIDWKELVDIIRANPEQPLMLEILRGNDIIRITVIPDIARENGNEIGKIGIAPQINYAELENLMVTVNYPVGTAVIKAVEKTLETTVLTFQMLGKMIIGDVSWKNISGPISIADYAGQTAQMGFAAYIGFLALISVSLAVLNLLPIPVLDGGHLMYYLIEIVRGAPLSEKAMFIGQQIGMAMLFTLIIFAIYNDIHRLVTE